MTPGELTKHAFERHGWHVGGTQRFIRPPGKRPFFLDLFRFIDGIAFHPKVPGTIGLQWTVGDRMADHVDKVRQIERDLGWADGATRRSIVFGWRQIGARGARKVWLPTTAEIIGGDVVKSYASGDGNTVDDAMRALGLVPLP